MKNEEGSSNTSRFSKNRLTKSHSEILTMQILLCDREVGNVIGKKGETIKTIRHQSGARIKITKVMDLQHIVKISGTPDKIYQATELIGLKIQEYFGRQNGDQNAPNPFLTVKLIMPIYQCGFIIGKKGCEINRIKKLCGADIHIETASRMLTNSTERLVSITGTTGKVSQCVYQVCITLLNSSLHSVTNSNGPRRKTSRVARSTVGLDVGKQLINSLANFEAPGLGTASTESNPAALAALDGSQLRTDDYQNHNVCGQHINQNLNSNSGTISMTVPNDLIGCIIDNNSKIVAEIQLKTPTENHEGVN